MTTAMRSRDDTAWRGEDDTAGWKDEKGVADDSGDCSSISEI